MIEYLDAELSFKTVSTQQRLLCGLAAAHNNTDRVRDIIDPAASEKAVKRLKSPSDVGCFIAHSPTLPVGIPQKIEATPQGLYTETYILKGSAGDNLLDVAKDLMDHGLSLGMSIGYKTHDSKMEQTAHGRVRRLLDLSILEYSFAPSQAIANPMALVSAIKARRGSRNQDRERKDSGAMQYRVEHDLQSDRWLVYCDADADGDEDDNVLIGTYESQEIANAVATALRMQLRGDDAGGEAPESGDDMGGKTAGTTEERVTWDAAYVNRLNDEAFLWVAPGGTRDDENRTVPRSNRHLPYRDAEGKVATEHLETAIARLGQDKPLPGVDDGTKAQLVARARRLLEQAHDGKTIAPAEEWTSGAKLALYGLGMRLVDLAEQLDGEHKAMALLGADTKDERLIRAPLRAQMAAVEGDLSKLRAFAETCERGEDGQQRLAYLRQQLALTEV